jgi:3-methyladenine DNA glycosylase AlkD
MDLLLALSAELRDAGTPERAISEKAYLKSSLEHYGASVPAVRAVAKSFARLHPDFSHDELVSLVASLWDTGVHEDRMVTVELLDLWTDRLGPEDMDLLEYLLRRSHTWASVDPLAGTVVGRLVEADPSLASVLDRWAVDPDFWIRRSALLALLMPLRRGDGDFERFARYADAMLDEREFFIRKAIGWVLCETGKRRPDLVFDWLLPRASRASGVTVREALKPLSEAQRAAITAVRS